ncbi:MAG: tRNA pseudouridine(38-40) synthase TruA [Chitinivibrionales bacterium]|nr:tRNA pseudouridine(38-40) synthase TruA [Chitinivibrionales bacterium]
MRYFCRVEYDGTAYHGWQRQPNGMSIQQALEEAFGLVTRQECAIVGSGRTDAGVHARRQGAHVDLPAAIDICACERSVNGVLPPDIAVFDLQPVADDFHARYSATERRYSYYIDRRKSPLSAGRAWCMTYAIDWDLLRREAASLYGTHDFAAFCASGSDLDSPVCTVRLAELEQRGNQWVFSIWANRFVYKMVRTVVGTLVDIGRGALDGRIQTIVASRDRTRAGPTAPACGLVLEDVIYPGVSA